MRVLVVIALLIAGAFVLLHTLVNLVRDLSQRAFPSPLDLSGSSDNDAADDDLGDTVLSARHCIAGGHLVDGLRGNDVGERPNALDDFHSAL
jgi:hypothetical protein